MRRLCLLFPLVTLTGAAAIAAPDDTERPHRTFVFVYEASVDEVPAGAREVRLWIPVPIDNADQKIGEVKFAVTVDGVTKEAAITSQGGIRNASPLPLTLAPIRRGAGRSLCVRSPGKPFSLKMSAEVTRYETRGGGTATDLELALARGEDRMIPIGGKASAMAAQIEDGEDTAATARNIYDHVLERMRYDKPAGGEWGRGDAEWACDARYGNCTDFHSYFMAIARTKNIPARFEMGFNVPAGEEAEATVGGYHCWAFFWDGGRWVPVDISEADKNPSRAEYFFGTLDHDRVTFSAGRDVVLTPAPAAGPLNFFVYPYAEVDGKEFSGVKRSFKRLNAE